MNQHRSGKTKLAVIEACANIGMVGFIAAFVAWLAFGQTAYWMVPGLVVAVVALVVKARQHVRITAEKTAQDDAVRNIATPASELEAKTAELFAKCCRDLPKSLASDKRSPFVGEKQNDGAPQFYVDLSNPGAPHANDVIAGVVALFAERGFEARHWNMPGAMNWDYLVLTAPSDWTERLLVPKA